QHAHPFTPAAPYVSWPPLLSPLSSLFSSLSPLFLLSSSSPSILPHSACTHTHSLTHTHTHTHTHTRSLYLSRVKDAASLLIVPWRVSRQTPEPRVAHEAKHSL